MAHVVVEALAGEVLVPADGRGEVRVVRVGARVEHADADALAGDVLAVHGDVPGVRGVRELQRLGLQGSCGRGGLGRGRHLGRRGELLASRGRRLGDADAVVVDHAQDVGVGAQSVDGRLRHRGRERRDDVVAVHGGGVARRQPRRHLLAAAALLEQDDDLDRRFCRLVGLGGRDACSECEQYHRGQDEEGQTSSHGAPFAERVRGARPRARPPFDRPLPARLVRDAAPRRSPAVSCRGARPGRASGRQQQSTSADRRRQ